MNVAKGFARRCVPAWIGLLVLVFTGVTATATATAARAAVAVGAKVGTLGVGAEVSADLATHWVFRGGIATYQRSLSYTASDIDYQGDLELLDATALIDWYPAGHGFRLTAGLAWNDHRLVGRAPFESLLTQTAPIPPGIVLPDLGTLRGEATVDSLGPYLGLGFGRATNGSASRWGISFDLGVVLHGEPQVNLTADSPFISQTPGLVALVDRLLDLEEQDLEREAKDFTYFPVLSVTVSYRF